MLQTRRRRVTKKIVDCCTSLSSTPSTVPRSVGPVIAGAAFAAGYLGGPLYVAAGLQAIYLLAFHRIFDRYEKQLPKS